jgi:hypothetical protein
MKPLAIAFATAVVVLGAPLARADAPRCDRPFAPLPAGGRWVYYYVTGFDSGVLSAKDTIAVPVFALPGAVPHERAEVAGDCFAIPVGPHDRRVDVRISYCGVYEPQAKTLTVPGRRAVGGAPSSPAPIQLALIASAREFVVLDHASPRKGRLKPPSEVARMALDSYSETLATAVVNVPRYRQAARMQALRGQYPDEATYQVFVSAVYDRTTGDHAVEIHDQLHDLGLHPPSIAPAATRVSSPRRRVPEHRSHLALPPD